MYRYGGSRPWSVAALAAFASVAATVLSGAASTALSGPTFAEEAAPAPAQTPAVRIPAPPAPAPQPAPAQRWQIQAGAFATRGAAEAHLRALAGRVPALADANFSLQPAGDLTRARFEGTGDRAAAERICAQIERAGHDCFVVPRGS